MTKLTLFATSEDYCLLKFKLVAAFNQIELPVSIVTAEELRDLDSSAKAFALKIDNSFLSQHLAILRYIAQAGTLLSSPDDLERAQIDQWLEFSVQELGMTL